MSRETISREQLLNVVRDTLESKPYALAMYEGGAAGFKRVDQWSDADIQIIVTDGSVEQAFGDLETALAELGETDYRYRLPEPTWHGHSQCFYRFKDASPFLMLDLVFIQESSEADRFMQFRTHGEPVVWFDKAGVVVEEPLDEDGMIARMQASLESARMRYDLFWILVEKEIQRKNHLEAFAFYYNFAFIPLLEVLRIVHSPVRFFYKTRYAHYDLPEDVSERLTNLLFVPNLDSLAHNFAQARVWFADVVSEINWDAVREKLVTSD